MLGISETSRAHGIKLTRETPENTFNSIYVQKVEPNIVISPESLFVCLFFVVYLAAWLIIGDIDRVLLLQSLLF